MTQENKKKLVKNTKSSSSFSFLLVALLLESIFFLDDIFRGRFPSKASVMNCSFAVVSCPSTFYMQTPFFRNLSICLYSKTILVPLLLCPTISKTFGGKTCLYRYSS